MRVLPHPARRVLLRDDGRAQRLRGPRRLRGATAVDRAAAQRVRGLERDVRARHRRRIVPARRRARRADPHRRQGLHPCDSPSLPVGPCASSSRSTWRGPTPGSTAPRARVPPRDGPAARVGAPGRGRHGDRGADDRALRGAGVQRGERHPLRRRALQESVRRPHVHPAVAVAGTVASSSSSTRCPTRSATSGWSWSTTRSCEAPRPSRSCSPCARPARPRCTSASPVRRSSGRASTASTCRPGRS